MSDDNKQQPTSEEVKAKVIEDFGFDADTQGEQIDKLTNERIESQKNLSKTIEQKAKYRDQSVKAGVIDPTTFEPIEKKPEGATSNKTNTEQGAPTMEHMALFGKGASLEGVKIAENVAKLEGITLSEAYNGEYVQSRVATIEADAKARANNLGASGGSAPAQRAKTVSNMTDDEHRSFAEEKLAGAMNA